MSVKKDIGALLDTKMDRKDFLRNVAVGLVAVTGVATALRAFAPKPAGQSTAVAPQGYGASAYGGATNKTS